MVRPKNRTYRIDGHVYEEEGSYAKYYGNGGSLLQSKRWVNVDHYDQFLTELRALLAQFDYQASRNDYPKIERALRSHFEKPFACSVRFPIDQSFLLLGSEWDTAITKAALATAFKDKTDERQATIGTSSNNTGTRRLPDGTEEKDGKKDWNLDNSKSAFAAALHDLNSLRESDDHVYDRFIFEDHFNMNWVCVDECVEKVCLQTCEDSTSFPSRTCVGFVRFKDKPNDDDRDGDKPQKKGCWFASVPKIPRKIASNYPKYVNDGKPPARNRAKVTLWMLARWPVLPRFSRLPLNYSYTLNDVAPSIDDFKMATSFSKLIENHKGGYQMDFDTPLSFVNLYYTKVDGDDEYVSGYRLYFSDCNYEIEFEDEKLEDGVEEEDEEEDM